MNVVSTSRSRGHRVTRADRVRRSGRASGPRRQTGTGAPLLNQVNENTLVAAAGGGEGAQQPPFGSSPPTFGGYSARAF